MASFIMCLYDVFYYVINIGRKIRMAKEKKNSNQVNQQVSLESLGSRTRATTTCEEANAPAPPTNCLLPSPLESF